MIRVINWCNFCDPNLATNDEFFVIFYVSRRCVQLTPLFEDVDILVFFFFFLNQKYQVFQVFV